MHNLGQIRGECDTLTVLYLGKINVKRLTTHRWHLVTKQDKTNNRKKKTTGMVTGRWRHRDPEFRGSLGF